MFGTIPNHKYEYVSVFIPSIEQDLAGSLIACRLGVSEVARANMIDNIFIFVFGKIVYF